LKKIVYMGTPHYAKEILQSLIDDDQIEVVLVITQPDRPVGRKKELKPPEVKVLAEAYGLPILQPQRLLDEGVYDTIVETKPDLIVVAAFGQLLPRSILDIAPCINLHASLLPDYRGASPVQQSLLNGDEFTGVSAMLMEEGLDSGPILGYRYFKIPDTMTLPELMDQLSVDAAILTLKTIHNFEILKPIVQIRAEATYCKKIRKSDGKVDLSLARRLYEKYRAFKGWPGIFLDNGIKLLEVELVESSTPHQAGVILSIEDQEVVVGCTQGSIRIKRIQPPSKKPMDAKSYCVGRGLKVDDSLF
jgi:methionyl-tRNA formyltransferase